MRRLGKQSDCSPQIAVLWALALILGLHALQAYHGFPNVDDFAYGPLTELWLDEGLYSGDEQIRSYVNHAWAYAVAYVAAKETIGLSAGFWLFTVLLACGSGLALFSILRRLGGGIASLPLALVLAGLTTVQGVGRAQYGGFIAGFFHHQGIALCLVAWSFAVLLGGRHLLAGILLGLAAYAQPMTALHGALAVAIAVLFTGRHPLPRLGIIAASAIATALPLAILMAYSGLFGNAPDFRIATSELIEKAYLFRAPHHYRLAASDVLLGWGWIAIGLLSARALRRNAAARPVAGLMIGFAALHLAATLGHHLWQSQFLPLYILDVTRSSSLAFALAATAFAAASHHYWQGGAQGDRPLQVAYWGAALLVFAILAATSHPIVWVLAAVTLAVIAVPALRLPGSAALAGVGLVLFAFAAPSRAIAVPMTQPMEQFYGWVRANTKSDALFIVPPAMDDFRLRARRGVYADFKMFSVAQPEQAWLTRQRLEQIAQPGPALADAVGWEGARAWDWSYANHADCAGILSLLSATGADYLVRQTGGSGGIIRAPRCTGKVQRIFGNSAFSVYRLSDES